MQLKSHISKFSNMATSEENINKIFKKYGNAADATRKKFHDRKNYKNLPVIKLHKYKVH